MHSSVVRPNVSPEWPRLKSWCGKSQQLCFLFVWSPLHVPACLFMFLLLSFSCFYILLHRGQQQKKSLGFQSRPNRATSRSTDNLYQHVCGRVTSMPSELLTWHSFVKLAFILDYVYFWGPTIASVAAILVLGPLRFSNSQRQTPKIYSPEPYGSFRK